MQLELLSFWQILEIIIVRSFLVSRVECWALFVLLGWLIVDLTGLDLCVLTCRSSLVTVSCFCLGVLPLGIITVSGVASLIHAVTCINVPFFFTTRSFMFSNLFLAFTPPLLVNKSASYHKKTNILDIWKHKSHAVIF